MPVVTAATLVYTTDTTTGRSQGGAGSHRGEPRVTTAIGSSFADPAVSETAHTGTLVSDALDAASGKWWSRGNVSSFGVSFAVHGLAFILLACVGDT